MSFVPTLLTGVSAGLQAFGAYKEGKDTKSAYDTAASEVEQAGFITQRQMNEQETSLLSTQTALYAKSGVKMTGSPLEVELQSQTDMEFDKMVAQWNTEVKAQNLRAEGAAAESASQLKIGETLIGGALKMSDYVGRIPTAKTSYASTEGTLG